MARAPAGRKSANDIMAEALARFSGFTDADVQAIGEALPADCDRDALAAILEKWTEIALADHLLLEPYPERRKRNARLMAVARASTALATALTSLTELDLAMLTSRMVGERGERPYEAVREERDGVESQLSAVRGYLYSLRQAAMDLQVTVKHRNPPNRTAYLVMLDFAEIFKCVSGLTATRITIAGTEGEGQNTGPFFVFMSAVWPIIFGNGDAGLSAALRQWATNHRATGDRSAFIANLRTNNV